MSSFSVPRISGRLVLAALLLGAMSSPAPAARLGANGTGRAAIHSPASALGRQLRIDSTHAPFSFIYGGRSSAQLLKNWHRQLTTKQIDSRVLEHTVQWSDAQTGLQVRMIQREYARSPVVEWTLYFKNNGPHDTPILEKVQPLDVGVPLTSGSVPTLLYSKGCSGVYGGYDAYALQKKPLNLGNSFALSSESGGKTIDTIPFFDLATKDRGLIGAVGWPGRWTISFARSSAGSVTIMAGMENTHLLLHPGEEIRTPEILLLPWQGDDLEAHNVLRRHILAWHTPHYGGQPLVLPLSHLGWGGMKTSTSLSLIDKISAASVGFENFWMDAGWYGKDRPVEEFQVLGREDWFFYAGDWRVNQTPHPDGRGLRPISDAAHAKGMKYLLWFEPERAVVGTPITVQHPDWFLGEESADFAGTQVKFRLLNFGNTAARQYMTQWMSDLITQQGIDIFRNDCNFALAPFWSQADESNRQGMTEIRYVEGLLSFWDELRRRHPGLILDIVQRGDLETISRAVDLSREDYSVLPEADPIGAQMSTEGLAGWRPHFGNLLELKPKDDYDFRSALAPGLAFAFFNVVGRPDQVGSLVPENFPFDWMRRMAAQFKRARPYFYGDYYPILPCSANPDCETGASPGASDAAEWAAWQFNRPGHSDGMVEAFRRSKNDDPAKDLPLHGLDAAARYQIADIDKGNLNVVSGKNLMAKGLHVEIPERSGAAILFYRKIGQ